MTEMNRKVRLGEFVIRIQGGVSLPCDDQPVGDGETGLLKLSAVTGGRFNPLENKRAKKTHRAVGPSVRANTVLMSRSNTANLVGTAAFVPEDYPNLHLPDLLWALEMSKPNACDAQWLAYLLQSQPLRRQLLAIAAGTSGSMKKISMRRLRTVEIALPSRDVRARHVGTLRLFDRQLDNIDSLIKVTRELKRGLSDELLTGRRRFPEFKSSPWRDIRLGDVLIRIERAVPWNDETVYSLLSVRRHSGGLFVRERRPGRAIKSKALFRVEPGDVLISRMQVAHGALALVRPEHAGMHVSGTYDVLRCSSSDVLDIEFFDLLTRLPQMYRKVLLACHGVHIEKMTFNLKQFLRTSIKVPTEIREQARIVSFFRLAETEIRLLEENRVNLQRQKLALVERLLSGQLTI